jgi:hypothetical protein
MARKKATGRLVTAVKRILYSAVILVLLTALVAGVLYLMITQPPGDYHPKVLSKAEQERADNRFNNEVADFYNSINRMAPFWVSFDEQTINERLLLDDVQKHLAELQKNSAWRLRQAQVSFDDDVIKLMGRITHDNVTSVLTVSLHPRITELGKLQIELGGVKAGVLTMPESVVQGQLGRLKEVLREASSRYPEKDKNDKNSLSTREFLEKLGMVVSEMEKQKLVTIDEVFRTQDKDTRLLAIKISEGKVELALESSWMEDEEERMKPEG